jgi:hypothetical protein
MAAAIVPIISAAAPLLAPLIVGLVKRVEGLFGAKTGATKLATVATATKAVADALSGAGKIPGVLDDPAIVALVEAVVQSLKGQGQLDAETATVGALPVGTRIKVAGILEVS